jgi:hypothetical protein
MVSGGSATVRRILIFDDHPDSLRLLFGRSGKAHPDRAAEGAKNASELIVASLLAVIAIVAVFWPLL